MEPWRFDGEARGFRSRHDYRSRSRRNDERARARFSSTPVLESRIPGILVNTFTLGGSELHVVTPRGAGPVADLVERGHRGLHHVAIRVDDLDAALVELREMGIRTLGEPIETLPGIREVFLDPSQTGGLLIQAVERRAKGTIQRNDP